MLEDALNLMGGGDYLYLRAGSYTQSFINYDNSAIMNLDIFLSFQNPVPSVSLPIVIQNYP